MELAQARALKELATAAKLVRRLYRARARVCAALEQVAKDSVHADTLEKGSAFKCDGVTAASKSLRR